MTGAIDRDDGHNRGPRCCSFPKSANSSGATERQIGPLSKAILQLKITAKRFDLSHFV